VSASSVVVVESPGPVEVPVVVPVALVVGAALVDVFVVVVGSEAVLDDELPPRSIGPASASPP